MVEMKLSFDPMTIEHLGFKMYSHLPNAVAELIANSYDADATTVRVVIETGDNQSVTVIDDGHGMTRDDLADRYLKIGRNRRLDSGGMSESGKRLVAGRKGLGKLALFGIGDRVRVRTKRAGSEEWTVVTLDWHDLKGAAGGEYRPRTESESGSLDDHGTEVLIQNLRRKSQISGDSLSTSLARLFNHVDKSFRLSVFTPKGEYPVTRDLRYASIAIESEWRVPEDVEPIKTFAEAKGIRGKILASEKPLPADMRGVTLYVHGRLANEPEYFGVPESSYAFSYLTGYVEADYIDDLPDDLIATDRRSVSWETPEGSELRGYLERVLRFVADRRRSTRRQKKKERLKSELGVSPDSWTDTIHGPEAKPVRDVLEVLTSPDSEISDSDRSDLVKGLREIAPEYADLHWRNLNPSIQDASQFLYRDGHYFQAVVEAIKRYVKDVGEACVGETAVDLSLLQKAFGSNARLDVFARYADSGFSDLTRDNVRTAQRTLSEGIWSGFRNPLSHEETAKLQESGAFTYQDCLDALSIVSHLRRRLEEAEPIVAE